MDSTRFEGLDTLRVVCSFSIVFLHVSTLSDSSLDLFLKFRDFALPVMVLTSFFLLTVSLRKKSQIQFNNFFVQKVKRLWLPLMIWSIIYALIMAFVLPVLFGIEIFGESLSPWVFLSGYRHLWYLQFLFIGSLITYPFIYWVLRNKKNLGVHSSIFCFCLTFLYGLLFYFFLKEILYYESDINLDIFISQTGIYIFYIPIGVGLGLMSDKISCLCRQNFFRHVSLGIVLVAMVIHLRTTAIPFTKELYGLTVFLAALHRWQRLSSPIWRRLAAYSYGIYILHFFLVQMLWMFLVKQNIGLNGLGVLSLTFIIYFLSFSTAMLIRKLLPFDFLLPLVTVNSNRDVKETKQKIFYIPGRNRSTFYGT